jgi:hypothetical protein
LAQFVYEKKQILIKSSESEKVRKKTELLILVGASLYNLVAWVPAGARSACARSKSLGLYTNGMGRLIWTQSYKTFRRLFRRLAQSS